MLMVGIPPEVMNAFPGDLSSAERRFCVQAHL